MAGDIILTLNTSNHSEDTRNFLDFFNQSSGEDKSSAVEQKITETTKLARVPKVLREDESIKECFEPKFVSIGPYHHGNPKLQAGEDHKKKLARSFFSDWSCSAETLYDKLYAKIKPIRDFYENELTDKYNDEALTRILFVDGCFLLYFIYNIRHSKSIVEDISFNKNHVISVVEDTCLLENQLPFLALKLLGENNSEKWPGLIEWYIEFICSCFIPVRGGLMKCNLQLGDFSHFVQLVQIGLQGSYKVKRDTRQIGFPSCYSVTELREVGIYCKPSRGGLKCISFRPHWFHGVLELPPIMVDRILTRANLLNLIAYEMHPDAHDLEIQSYIFFLASILRQPQDVKALREARVLYNYIGSDEEMLKLFKEIDAKLSKDRIHGHVIILLQIGNYLDKRGRTKIANWLAEVFTVYFRSPWTTVTVLAGCLALSATIIQTVLQIFSNN